jgi:DNA-binding GntR family transcriptional regulator
VAGYADIAAHFRRQIETGELRPGDRLPTVREVMQQFQVAQQTASRAYKVLKAAGLTTATTGGGTEVAALGSSNIASRVQHHAATGRALSSQETSHILEVGTVGADEAVASRLEVEPGTLVYVRRRVVTRDGAPVHTSSSYYLPFVVEATPELAEPVSTGASRELAAERLGVAQDNVLEELTSRFATETEKELLGLTGSPVNVHQVIRTVYLADGRVVEVAVKVVGGSTVLRYPSSLR